MGGRKRRNTTVVECSLQSLACGKLARPMVLMNRRASFNCDSNRLQRKEKRLICGAGLAGQIVMKYIKCV
jgi:hypothetical protein